MCYSCADILHTKDQALAAYKMFAAWAFTQHRARIKALCSDHGSEFTGHEFTKFLQQEGTVCHLTTHNTPQHNGIAETLNCRLMECIHTVLHHSELPKYLWAEALCHSIWLKNQLSTCALKNNSSITPYKSLYSTKPDLSGIPVWGQSVWVYSSSGSKLDARGLEARWIRFDADSPHVHRIYWIGKCSVSVECNIKFTIPTVTASPFTPVPHTSSHCQHLQHLQHHRHHLSLKRLLHLPFLHLSHQSHQCRLHPHSRSHH
jgi:hypothetical protein